MTPVQRNWRGIQPRGQSFRKTCLGPGPTVVLDCFNPTRKVIRHQRMQQKGWSPAHTTIPNHYKGNRAESSTSDLLASKTPPDFGASKAPGFTGPTPFQAFGASCPLPSHYSNETQALACTALLGHHQKAQQARVCIGIPYTFAYPQ